MVPPPDSDLALTSLEQDFLHHEIDVPATQVGEPGPPSTSSPKASLGTPRTQAQQEWEAIQKRAWGQGIPSTAQPRVSARRPTTARHEASSTGESTHALPTSCLTQLQEVERLQQLLAASLSGQEQDTSSHAAGHVAALCRQYNRAAMRCVEAGHGKESLRLLEKAQVLCEEEGVLKSEPGLRNTLMAVTLNNLGVYHQRNGAMTQALKVLQQATEMEDEALDAAQQADVTSSVTPGAETDNLELVAAAVDGSGGEKAGDESGMDASGADTPASTRLNLCTVLSGLGRHGEALQCVSVAIQQLCGVAGITEQEVMNWASNPQAVVRPGTGVTRPNADGTAGIDVGGTGGGAQGALSPMSVRHRDKQELIDGVSPQTTSGGVARQRTAGGLLRQLPTATSSVLAMCLYNKAVQMEHLTLNADAYQHYCAGAGLATKLFGRSSNLSRLFTKSLQAFSCKIRRLGPHALQRTRASSTPQPPTSIGSGTTPTTSSNTPQPSQNKSPPSLSPRGTPTTSGTTPSPYQLLPTRPPSGGGAGGPAQHGDSTVVKLKRQVCANSPVWQTDMYMGQQDSKSRGLRPGSGLLRNHHSAAQRKPSSAGRQQQSLPVSCPPSTAEQDDAKPIDAKPITLPTMATTGTATVKPGSADGRVAPRRRIMSAGLPHSSGSLMSSSTAAHCQPTVNSNTGQVGVVALKRQASLDAPGSWGRPPDRALQQGVDRSGAGPGAMGAMAESVFSELEGLMDGRKKHLAALKALVPKQAGGGLRGLAVG